MRKKFLNERIVAIYIVILSIPAIWALFVPGFYGASDDLHIAWLHQMDAAIKMGQFPPRFVPDLSFGFGYPLFNFVFPLPFYLGEAFHLLGLSLVDSVKGVFVLSVVLSGYFMYKLTREYASAEISLAASALYIFTPYRATDIYVRGALGESFAFIFFPLVMHSMIKAQKGSGRGVGLLAVSIAGLTLSHNIAAYMFMPFVLLFWLLGNNRLNVLFGILLGLLMSSYFWVSALIESRLVVQDTVFNFIDHFPAIAQLATPFFGYGASVPGPGDGMSFFVGVLNILIPILVGTLFVLGRLRLRSTERRMLYWLGFIVLASIFMMNHRSTFAWRSIPLVPFFQFPWRFLMMITFATSVSVVFLDRFGYSKLIAVFVIVFAVLLNFKFFRPQDFLGRQDDYYINRYIPTPVASDAYKQTSEEYLRLSNSTMTRPEMGRARVEVTEGDVLNLNLLNGLEADFEVESESGTRVFYNKYKFPGWKVNVNGEQAEVFAGEPFGQVAFLVPQGRSAVSVRHGETSLRLFFDIISLAVLGMAMKLAFKREKI